MKLTLHVHYGGAGLTWRNGAFQMLVTRPNVFVEISGQQFAALYRERQGWIS